MECRWKYAQEESLSGSVGDRRGQAVDQEF